MSFETFSLVIVNEKLGSEDCKTAISIRFRYEKIKVTSCFFILNCGEKSCMLWRAMNLQQPKHFESHLNKQ